MEICKWKRTNANTRFSSGFSYILLGQELCYNYSLSADLEETPIYLLTLVKISIWSLFGLNSAIKLLNSAPALLLLNSPLSFTCYADNKKIVTVFLLENRGKHLANPLIRWWNPPENLNSIQKYSDSTFECHTPLAHTSSWSVKYNSIFYWFVNL